MKKLSWQEFVGQFDLSTHKQLEEQRRKPGVVALVCAENHMFESSCFGRRSALIVGPDCTYKSVESCEGKWLYDLPSQRQYFQNYTEDQPVELYSQEIWEQWQILRAHLAEADRSLKEAQEAKNPGKREKAKRLVSTALQDLQSYEQRHGMVPITT